MAKWQGIHKYNLIFSYVMFMNQCVVLFLQNGFIYILLLEKKQLINTRPGTLAF